MNRPEPLPGARQMAAGRPHTHCAKPRRPKRASPGQPSNDGCARSLISRSPQGELRFSLKYDEGGLYVEREEIPSRGLHCVQTMHFRDVRQFEQWCDADPARFEHPMLHLTLRRDAGTLWQLADRGES